MLLGGSRVLQGRDVEEEEKTLTSLDTKMPK
jgi:hypothetical protein